MSVQTDWLQSTGKGGLTYIFFKLTLPFESVSDATINLFGRKMWNSVKLHF